MTEVFTGFIEWKLCISYYSPEISSTKVDRILSAMVDTIVSIS